PLKFGHRDSDAGRLNPGVRAAYIRLRSSRVRRNRIPPAAELLWSPDFGLRYCRMCATLFGFQVDAQKGGNLL
ncbi:MAG: hypothetical protein ABSE93_18410, partial [Terriglobia bacterium]